MNARKNNTNNRQNKHSKCPTSRRQRLMKDGCWVRKRIRRRRSLRLDIQPMKRRGWNDCGAPTPELLLG